MKQHKHKMVKDIIEVTYPSGHLDIMTLSKWKCSECGERPNLPKGWRTPIPK